MVFRDQKLVCQKCGGSFIFTVTEQRCLAEEVGEDHVAAPVLCPKCRPGGAPKVPRHQARAEPEPPREVPTRRARESEEAADEVFPLEEEGVQVKLIGHVKWFSLDKGYGFITKADGKDRQSAHIRDDQRVEFQVRRTEKGLEAFNVSILPEE